MGKPIDDFWKLRLEEVKAAFELNNFEVFLADNSNDAKNIIVKKIIPQSEAKSVSWGGSMTFTTTGIYDAVKEIDGLEILDVFDKNIPGEKAMEMRRQALLVDLFITGTNAITESGQLVNLDMHGNRVGAITFGPKNVIIVVGRNKIVGDIEDAMCRIKDYAAPVNTKRLNKKTPCSKTSFCDDCKSPDRICNTWTITEKSFPKGRIKVVLINEDLGF